MEDKIIIIKSTKLHKDLLKYVVKIRNKFYVHHFLVNSIYPVDIHETSPHNTLVNDSYKGNLKRYNRMIKNSEYQDVTIIVEKKFQLEWFFENYKKVYEKLGEQEYYELLGRIFTLQEFHYFTKKFYPILLYYGKDPLLMMSEDNRRVYNNLPEQFIVYRGISSKKPLKKEKIKDYIGNSWTLDKNISIRFSKELLLHSEKKGFYYVLSYPVMKSEVLSYFNDRKEEEIFLDHTKIDVTKVVVEEIK